MNDKKAFSFPLKVKRERKILKKLLPFVSIFSPIPTSLLLLLCLGAVLVPMLSHYHLYDTHLLDTNAAPSYRYWFGTDELGRDIFARCFSGVRLSLFVGTAAALIDLTIGMIFGAIAAFSNKRIDECMMRFIDILTSIPSMLWIILLILVLGPGLTSVLVALTLTGWMPMARIVRSEIKRLKSLDFIKAEIVLGASFWRILFKHLLPNCSSSILVTAMLTIPSAIFSEAFLSFLGLGVQPPFASLGSMVNNALPALRYYPWRLFAPASLITLIILLFYILADRLQSRLSRKEVIPL